MHRTTPLASAFVAFTGGGARALVDTINDATGMQNMKGSFMYGEARDKIESPQNYGFTSVVKEATKGADGMIEACAEAFMSFMGGNRSFPIATVMDDRRFRLKELKPGDVGIYDHQQQQFHFNSAGAFLTSLVGKKMRFALAEVDSQQQSGAQATTQADGGGGAAGGATQASNNPTQHNKGQKARYEKESKQYIEVNKDATESMNKSHKIMLDDKDTMVHIADDKKVYLGGEKGKHRFSPVVTVDGPSINVYARID